VNFLRKAFRAKALEENGTQRSNFAQGQGAKQVISFSENKKISVLRKRVFFK
jgi:hypothetical protein